VQESVVGVVEVHCHLTKYGLERKEPEGLDGGQLLGIALRKDYSGHLHMSRGTLLIDTDLSMTGLTKLELFLLCDQLVGCYQVDGWLCIHCSFLKHLGSS